MMYTPKINEEKDISVLQKLIQTHPLSTWVTLANGELLVNNIPFLLDSARGEFGTLAGHIARANPLWQTFSKDVDSILIFQGAETYISPSWYPSKQEHGKVVPTWNYAVVHAHGMPQVITDSNWLRQHVSQLTDFQESAQVIPWSVNDAPTEYIDSMLQAIVGVEIPIKKLVGKWKISQNRNTADKKGVVAGLRQRNNDQSHAMATLLEQHITPNK